MLKRNHNALDTFSMSSMTDVIFLLLIFFLVTSTFVTPAAVDVNLPQAGEQSTVKPQTEVYIDSEEQLWLVADRNDSIPESTEARAVSRDELLAALTLLHEQDSTRSVALYADSTVRYARVVEILDATARHNLHLLLATKVKR